MTALLIAVITAASLLWAPAADAHPANPVMAGGATAPADATGAEAHVPPAAIDNGLLILAVLVAAVGAPCLTRRLRRPTLALVTAGSLVNLLAGSAPHLVHHAFEPGKGAECQVLQVASHADGALDNPDVPPIVMAAVRLDPDLRLPAGAAPAPSPRTRAPPA